MDIIISQLIKMDHKAKMLLMNNEKRVADEKEKTRESRQQFIDNYTDEMETQFASYKKKLDEDYAAKMKKLEVKYDKKKNMLGENYKASCNNLSSQLLDRCLKGE